MRNFVFVIAMLLSLASCSSDLENLVACASSHCPIPIPGVGFIREISLHGDTLYYDCAATEPGLDLTERARHADRLKTAMAPQILSLFDRNGELLQAVRDNRLTLTLHYAGAGGSSLDISFAPDEIAALPDPGRRAMSPEERLQREIALSATALPAQLDEGVMMVDVVDSDSMVVFECVVDESLLGDSAMTRLEANLGRLRAQMLESLTSRSDPDTNTLVEISTAASRGIAYRYTGSLSGRRLAISFPLEELTSPAIAR